MRYFGSQSSSTYPGYTGYSPSTSPPTIERQWTSYNPVLSVSDPMMTCNGGTSAPLNATIAAGTNMYVYHIDKGLWDSFWPEY